jgi:hypothetical protein
VQAITKESRILETLIVSHNANIMDPIKYDRHHHRRARQAELITSIGVFVFVRDRHECPCLLAVDFRSTKLKDEALCAIAR